MHREPPLKPGLEKPVAATVAALPMRWKDRSSQHGGEPCALAHRSRRSSRASCIVRCILRCKLRSALADGNHRFTALLLCCP